MAAHFDQSSSQSAECCPYQRASFPIEERVEDLLRRMTLAEKAGQMFHQIVVMGEDGSLAGPNPAFHLESVKDYVTEKCMTHFNLMGAIQDAPQAARWYNTLQEFAIRNTRLGIPITVSSDPRNHYAENAGTGFEAGCFSQWPETLGFAALADPGITEEFANIARQEYLAVGIRTALHPQVDLATEPRWARISLTFGEDAELTSRQVAAYIRGFQGQRLSIDSVATMTKHFPGGGPQLNGEDPHFDYGKEQVYPGKNFDYHLEPFKHAIAAGTAQMMPYYGKPVGTEFEEVGFSFSHGIVNNLLRNQLGFQGIACTDWGLITDTEIMGQPMPARAWGCEHLTEMERVQKILDAGCDQFGGESRPELVVQLVESGKIPESRIDESVSRLLRQKFELGLFDNPFVDESAALATVGNPQFRTKGEDIQSRSFTLLKNDGPILPLNSTLKQRVYVEGIKPEVITNQGLEIAETIDVADLAIVRWKAPYEPRPGAFEAMFHAGSLEFPEVQKSRQARILTSVPTIVDIYLDRPAVIPEIAETAKALLASYGSSDQALANVLFGKVQPQGRLPFDMPSSMQAVESSRSDVPYDTKNPLFRFGHGLSY